MPHSILTRLEKTGPYSISVERIESIRSQAAALHYALYSIAPQGAASTGAWLQSLGRTLGFPAHFGANFDALCDCLCDRAIMPQDNCLLLIAPTALPREDRNTLLTVSRAACDEWRSEGRRLWILFASTDTDLDPLPAQ